MDYGGLRLPQALPLTLSLFIDYVAFTQPTNVPFNFMVYVVGLILQVRNQRNRRLTD